MKYQSFNSFLLTTVVKNFRLGIDPQSLLKRHQTLSIIYMNLAYIFMGGGFELLSIIFGYGYHHLVPIVSLFTISSLLCLRNGRNDYATLIALMYAHISNAFISHWGNTSMGALTAVFMLPNFSFFMCSSTKVHYINIGICVLQVCGHLRRIVNIFGVTVNADQKDEITNLVAGAIPCFIFLCFSLVVQKSVENSIWQAAISTQEKNEKINREIMQAVESKDAFISSLSHEIRNPLNAMNGTINYLLHVVHDPKLQQVLQNARISGETLLVLFTNLLDAAKLKSEKMELYYNDTNIYETLKRVLIINCENIKQKKIFVDGLVDQSIPQIIQSDGARLLQILMNLLSNAIKFTPEEGKIVICATLCHKNLTKEKLEAQLTLPAFNDAGISWLTHQETQSDISNTSVSSISSLETDHDCLLTEEFTQEEVSIRLENLKRMRSLKNNEGRQSSLRYRKLFGQNEPWRIQKINMNSEIQENAQSLLESDQSYIQDYYLKIQIIDTGCGIADENISKLFEMFTQAHNRVISSHGGTGLGLWICKQLCQKMGGDIKLYSKLNEGTSFVFYLPVSSRGLFETQASQSEIATSAATTNNNIPNQFPDKTYCLVVDDLSYNRELHKLLLEREGVQVIVGCDGEEAIEKYLANLGKLDFIFMDVQMPKMDGFTAARKIRELEAQNNWKRVDIYFVSGEYYNEEEVMASFRTQKGEDGQALRIQSLKKPIDIEVISKITAKYTKKG